MQIVLTLVMLIWFSEVMVHGYNTSSSARCLNAYESLSSEQLARFVDASGKPGSGIYGGNTLWFGSFSECKKQRNSRYCLAMFPGEITLAKNNTKIKAFKWGVCVPSQCVKENVVDELGFLMNNISRIEVRPLYKDLRVECAQDAHYSTGVILTIILCVIILGLCLLATALEAVKEFLKKDSLPELEKSNDFCMNKNGKANEKTPLLPEVKPCEVSIAKDSKTAGWLYEVINCFSITRNVRFIMNTSVGRSDLTYLHGIRVLSLFWVIFNHTSGAPLANTLPTDNPNDVRKLFHRISMMVYINVDLSVCTFFLLSGLLVIYVNLMRYEKTKAEPNWAKFYFHRFWRLTPFYMFAILFVTNLRPLLGAGPLWFIARDTSACADYWWTNLLYINNFVHQDSDETCFVVAWYLAVDMQLFVISPVLLITAYRYGFRRFAALSSMLILTGVATTAIIIGTKDLKPLNFPDEINQDKISDFHRNVYTKPYCRLPPYVFGIILGYVLFKHFSTKIRVHWHTVIILWLLASGVALAVVYAPHNAVKENPRLWTTGESVIYGSLKWPLWSMCVAWVILACHYGYAGVVKDILAAKFWIPLSRINYAAFILHAEIILTLSFNTETPIHFTTFSEVVYFLAVLVLSYVCAFIFTALVELPCTNLESIVMKKITKK